jgi:hypothetical protein
MIEKTAADKTGGEKQVPPKSSRPARRIEEIHFLDYISHKKTHKHIEEVGVEGYLSRKKSPKDL